MLYGLYLSAMGLKGQETKQAVISNNIANAQTTGFKRDLAVMRARANAAYEDPAMAQYRLPVVRDQGGGVWITSAGIDLTQGGLQDTNHETDFALDGKGFFTVEGNTPGQTLLTRDGHFLLSDDGTLITPKGRPVLSADGNHIKLNTNLPVHLDADGRITQTDGGPGTVLGIVDVSDPGRLKKLGANLLTVDKPEVITERNPTTVVYQNQLESSGVDPLIEMVNMIAGQRAFDANARLISYQDQTLAQLNTIGRVA